MNGDENKSELLETAAAPARSYYDEFVESVATREIVKNVGADPSRTAKVFLSTDDDGSTVNLSGEKEIVSELGNIMERGGYRVREWHIRRPEDLEQEAHKVVPALEGLVESAPRQVLPRLGEKLESLRVQLGLPRFEPVSQLLEIGDGAVDVVDDALKAVKEFSEKGGDKE